MWSSHSQVPVNLNRRISDGITDMKNMTSLQVFRTIIQHTQDQDQDTRLRMPNNWPKCKDGKAGNTKRQRRGLLVF
jgi:hypothetical protein